MKKIPSAKELFSQLETPINSYPVGRATYINIEDARKLAKEFARLHYEGSSESAYRSAV